MKEKNSLKSIMTLCKICSSLQAVFLVRVYTHSVLVSLNILYSSNNYPFIIRDTTKPIGKKKVCNAKIKSMKLTLLQKKVSSSLNSESETSSLRKHSLDTLHNKKSCWNVLTALKDFFSSIWRSFGRFFQSVSHLQTRILQHLAALQSFHICIRGPLHQLCSTVDEGVLVC